jgi:hypothetical protein
MKKDDLIILLIALLLLAGMLITIFFGGARSRHGVSLLFPEKLHPGVYMTGHHLRVTVGRKIRATSFS